MNGRLAGALALLMSLAATPCGMHRCRMAHEEQRAALRVERVEGSAGMARAARADAGAVGVSMGPPA